MKTVKIELNQDELVLISSGLGHYFDYLDAKKKKEKTIARKRELSKIQDDIDKLKEVINEARFALG